MRQFIGIAKDHSGSMYSLTRPAIKDYNETLKSIQTASAETDIDTIASVVRFGGSVQFDARETSVRELRPLTHYPTGGGTPLFDAVDTLIDNLASNPAAKQKDATFLVMAITDGEENQSRISAITLSEKMKKLQATDRWTFVFRVPKGYARNLTRLGIPEGNIQEWEQNESSLRESTAITQAAIGNYYKGVTRGVKSTQTFYADLSQASVNKVKSVMVDISKEVKIFTVRFGRPDISSFLADMTGAPYVKGTGFYQLIKPEKAVQDYKLIVIKNKKTGVVYYGSAARDLLGLPTTETIKLIPGNHGDWDIYIQSTSTNRVLPEGTSVLLWKNVR